MKIGLDISVLNSPQKTGIAVYTYELIKALLEINKKDEFKLFGISTFETYDSLKNIEFKKYPNVKIIVHRLPAKLFRLSFINWQKFEWPTIENFIGELDIYHSFNWYFPPQKKGKKVATIFDMTPTLFPKYHHKRTVQLENLRLERIKEFANLVITISDSSKKDFLKFSPDSVVEVVYPAADNFNLNISQSRKVLKKYNLNPGYFLSVATFEPRKNLTGLLNAYLKGKFEKDLVLVGLEGWGDDEISKLIKSSNKVKIVGYIPDKELPYFYKNAICLVYPSFYEGFGLPVLEAMSLGVPVICSNTSSLPEVGGDAPLYVVPDDENDLRKALIKIDKDKSLRDQLIKKGWVQAKKFSWRKSAQKLVKLYHNL